ncbi:MAG: 2-amino-4-hydroxy-6-hydroxymethyldihydropteridine diphosphokinase [Ostreibacterium sp.]
MNIKKSMAVSGTRAFIALGANLGNPIQQLDRAVLALGAKSGIIRIAMSKIYRSQPHGPKDQPDYLNAVLEVRTILSPKTLLSVLHDIEDSQGRIRQARWAARTIDLDLILFGDTIENSPSLTLPHPCAHEREFVIQPLIDLDKTLFIPKHGAVLELVKKLPVDTLEEIRNVKTYHC